MERTLTIKLPEEIFEPLQASAEHAGVAPEQIAVTWLVAGMEKFMHDPVEEFIGMIRSDVPDLAENHDRYFADSILQEFENSAE